MDNRAEFDRYVYQLDICLDYKGQSQGLHSDLKQKEHYYD